MQLSAHVDGELPESEAELLIRRLSQDSALRTEVAEFIEIGRSLRGELAVAGIHGLRCRIQAVLDSGAALPAGIAEPQSRQRFFKPLGGLAVAVTVAVVAIAGFERLSTVDPVQAPEAGQIAGQVDYVVPPEHSDFRKYLRMHGESTFARGANGMGARLASFELIDVAARAATPQAQPEDIPARGRAGRSCIQRVRPMTRHLCLALGLMAGAGTAMADDSPHEWLDRMAAAVQTAHYAGTVIRQRHGETESLKVAHAIEDGVVRERMVAQEGSGLEIVRRGNEVHRILPDKKTVLVEQWNDQSTLFSTLPDSDLRFGNEYDLLIKRKARVAGRAALELAIQPHDNYRYGIVSGSILKRLSR